MASDVRTDVVIASYEGGQDIRDRTFKFACRVVRLCQHIYERGGVGRLLVQQVIDASTSLAAMLEEARAAESDRDFISKCSIGLKECRESWTRLRVYQRCHIGNPAEVQALVEEANELISIVTAIIRHKRTNSRVANQTQRRRRRTYEFKIPNS
jgi:four helix bundle protein